MFHDETRQLIFFFLYGQRNKHNHEYQKRESFLNSKKNHTLFGRLGNISTTKTETEWENELEMQILLTGRGGGGGGTQLAGHP